MSEGTNMICPACGAFQPRAEICKKCGIIIAKATSQKIKQAAPPAVKVGTGKPPVAMIILAAVIGISLIGYFLFSTTGDTVTTATDTSSDESPAKPAAKSEIDRIATINPAVANNLQRSQVQGKLNTVRTMLNIYIVENAEPPSTEEGLQSLVSKGVITASDITDEWGNSFVYRLEWGKETALEREYEIFIFSKGPDGVSGTADDISI